MGRIYLNLLILCTILSEGIGSFRSEESLDLLVRSKRVVDKTVKRPKPVPVEDAYYIVSLLENGYHICTATLLSFTVAITAAHCVEDPSTYTILSGTSFSARGQEHDVKKLLHPEYQKRAFPHDIALLIMSTPVHLPNRPISIFEGDVKPHTLGTITGWGSTSLKRRTYPKELRSTTVLIISQEACTYMHRGRIAITEKNICTHDPTGQKCCGYGDSGSPLVVGNELVGIYGGSAGSGGGENNPDVFMKVGHPDYKRWIDANMPRHPLILNPQISQNTPGSQSSYKRYRLDSSHGRYSNGSHGSHESHFFSHLHT